MRKLAQERMGQIRKNNLGSLMELVKYKNANDIWVRFVETDNLVHTSWQCFCKGDVKNVYDKSIFNIGYIGEGAYKPSENGKDTIRYTIWKSMLIRCYDKKYSNNNPTYFNCTVVEEWHNFQTFAQWYDQNFYEIDGEKMCLDKDILIKGNKIYSPDTCVFVPHFINTLFVKSNSRRGDLPVGVYFDRKYRARCNNKGKGKYLGSYNTFEEAFRVYKLYKEKLIKSISEEYKDKIPLKLYNAMINYIVEIDD